ncbi:MAG: hypothetical protein V4525_07900 [Pseudomonadota bacterium]
MQTIKALDDDQNIGNEDYDGGSSYGYSINSSGQVTGISSVDGTDHAFLYTPNKGSIKLAIGSSSTGYGINDSGKVVGEFSVREFLGYNRITETPGAFLYTPGKGMQDLKNLIDPSSGITLAAAYDINNADQIVAQGTNGRAYLLSPTPEPEIYATMLIGLSLMALRRKKLSARKK